jgi:NADH dehydrogenase [ubiquinone] 1 alpha subcomplex assembly factor 3
MDILANAGAVTPANSIDACLHDGFHLNNGQQTVGGMGLLLLDGEAFVWTPWDTNAVSNAEGFGKLLDKRGIINIPKSSLGVLELVYPKPDLLIIGTGRKLWMLGKETRKYLSETLGIRVDVMDTGNAAAAYNLLAMERGITEVAGLMIPDGFRGM